MNLPNYFLADLPPEASLNPGLIGEACQTLKRNREQFLAGRSTAEMVNLLSSVAADWLSPDDPFRKEALDHGPAATGFSRATLTAGLDSFFQQLTRENLEALVEQDLGQARRLDQLSSTNLELGGNRAAMALGPEFLVHIAAGNLPVPILASMVLGLLVRSAQFVKCARGAALLPRLFAHSVYQADRKLGACLEIVAWPGGSADLEAAVFEHADCLTATGTDETLASIRGRLPARVRFLGYGHRVSFAYVGNDVLAGPYARKIADRAACDVAAWNQLGCLSPHVIYVQRGGEMTPEAFAGALADALARREEYDPRGELPVEAAAAIAMRRSLYEVRAAHSPETRHWFSQNSTAWTVIYEGDPGFQFSCLHRFIYVKSVNDLTNALQSADSLRARVSTVGIAAAENRQQELARELARWGVPRVCPLGRMQNPPLAWRHDGRPALGDLVTWTDWEM